MEWRRIKDRLFFPLVAFLSSERARALHLTPLDDERLKMGLERCRGLVLDIGCGRNELVRRYRAGEKPAVGIDLFSWPGIDLRGDTVRLPFADKAFETVSLLACLNHISPAKRDPALQEIRRVLKDEGRILISMLSPWIGYVTHKVRRRVDFDQVFRGMGEQEEYGLSGTEMRGLLVRNGFHLVEIIPFVFRLNRLYVAAKRDWMIHGREECC